MITTVIDYNTLEVKIVTLPLKISLIWLLTEALLQPYWGGAFTPAGLGAAGPAHNGWEPWSHGVQAPSLEGWAERGKGVETLSSFWVGSGAKGR